MDKKVHEIYCNSCGKKMRQQTILREKITFPSKRNGDTSQKKTGKYTVFFCVNPVMIYGRSSLNFL